MGIQPSGKSPLGFNLGITISKDFAYVSNYNTLYAKANFQNLTPGKSTINIICLKCNKIIAPTVSIGQSPSTITLFPDNKKLYVCKYCRWIIPLTIDNYIFVSHKVIYVCREERT